MIQRIRQWSRKLGMRRTAREMAIGSSGGTSYYPEYYWKSETGAP
jgi:hypothetical protein